MKCLRRNLAEFDYRAYAGREEVIVNERHTGRYEVTYADPVKYRGNISVPSGLVQNVFPGIVQDYTHVLVMDDPDADIAENGMIDWKGDTYQIMAVNPSLNVLSVALKKLTKSHTEG